MSLCPILTLSSQCDLPPESDGYVPELNLNLSHMYDYCGLLIFLDRSLSGQSFRSIKPEISTAPIWASTNVSGISSKATGVPRKWEYSQVLHVWYENAPDKRLPVGWER